MNNKISNDKLPKIILLVIIVIVIAYILKNKEFKHDKNKTPMRIDTSVTHPASVCKLK